MLTTFVLNGLLPVAAIVLLGACLVASAIGFFRVVFFISIGYGLSIAVMAVLMLAMTRGAVGWITWAQSLLLTVYGLRLAIFLALRERDKAYQAVRAADGDRGGRVSIGISILIWVSVSALYVCMFMPALGRFVAAAAGRGDPLPVLSIVGVCIMAAGILVEAVADAQKSRAKRAASRRFCDTGLYRVVRSPNYFGELLVWTGSACGGASLLSGWLAWVLAAIGYVCIVLIMVGSARRLEIRQDERYGKDPDYQRYVKTVPVLVPLLPIYSVRNARIYLG